MLVRPFYSTPVYLHSIPLGMCEEECLCLCHCISQACSDHYGPILWETFNVEAEGIAGCPRRAVLIPVMFGLDIPASFYCFLILPIFTNPSCNCYFSHIFVALLKCNILDIFFTFLIFLFTDDKEDTVLGNLPLLSFQIGGVELSENITCKFAFKVSNWTLQKVHM